MKERLITGLLVIELLSYPIMGDVCAQGREERSIEDSVTLIRTFPQTRDDAGQVAQEALKRAMSSARIYDERGIMLLEKGEYDLAVEEFNKALQINPKFPEALNNRGIAYSQKGEYDLAISDFSKALETEAGFVKALYNRGFTYAKTGQYFLALEDFDRVIEINPIHAYAYINRGGLHAQLACSDWERACKLGNCGHLEEAVKIGLCIRANASDILSP